jgi:hypothetical protein
VWLAKPAERRWFVVSSFSVEDRGLDRLLILWVSRKAAVLVDSYLGLLLAGTTLARHVKVVQHAEWTSKLSCGWL